MSSSEAPAPTADDADIALEEVPLPPSSAQSAEAGHGAQGADRGDPPVTHKESHALPPPSVSTVPFHPPVYTQPQPLAHPLPPAQGVYPYAPPPQIQQPAIGPIIMQPASNPINIINNNQAATPTGLYQNLGRDWHSDLCSCASDMKSCCLACFCFPCFACMLSDELGEGCCMPMWVPMSTMALRIKIRSQNNIRGTICRDCCLSIYCHCCVMCQIKREFDFVCKEQCV